MFDWLRRRQLQKAFNQYVYKLGPALTTRYGSFDQFTVMQIQATAQFLKLDTRFMAYAVALYRHQESENTLNLLGVDQAFLDQLRLEIANSLFNGNLQYSANDVLGLSKKICWRGGAPPNWMANRFGQTSI